VTEQARATQAANATVFTGYAGAPFMHDPGLRARLAGVDVPALVLWGESDGIVDVDYGRAYAAALPGAELLVVREAGHLPQVEQTAAVADLVRAFATGARSRR
jgi:pimeloyl-ACP methyl ester carboxylesterase